MSTTLLTSRDADPEPGERAARERLIALRTVPPGPAGRSSPPERPSPPDRSPRPDRSRPSGRDHPAAAGRRPAAPPVAPRPVPAAAAVETTSPLPVVGSAAGRFGRIARRRLPRSWPGARIDPGRRGSLALIAVAGLAAAVAAVGVWRDRPVAEAAPPLTVLATPASTDRAGAATAAPGPAGAKGAPLVLSVAGKVRKPGLVTVPDGARVADAITAAGGPLPRVDLTPLNLARRVTDGEQLLVGVPAPPAGTAADAPGPDAARGGGPAPSGTGKVDLNRATLEQLDTLPGVGPVTAQRILDWRAAHGRFTAVEQLREIEGIGERRFGQLRGQVTV